VSSSGSPTASKAVTSPDILEYLQSTGVFENLDGEPKVYKRGDRSYDFFEVK